MPRRKNLTPSVGERLFTDDDLLNTLRAYVAAVPKPTKHGFDAWPARLCNAGTIALRFGSWADGLRRVGISQPRRKAYSGEELISRLELVWRRLGRAPGANTLELHGNISRHPYIERWGSVRLACRALHLYRKGRITREYLLRGRARHRRSSRRLNEAPGAPATAAPRPRIGRKHRSVRARLRYQILERDGFRCVLCGASPAADPAVRLEIDHVTPFSRGGPCEASNLRTTCHACNQGKRADP